VVFRARKPYVGGVNTFAAFYTTLFLLLTGGTAMAADQTLYDFTLIGNDGKPMPLSQFKGRAVLLVNTASECGFTPQYDELEKLWEAKKDAGLVIIGVPSNDFGGQEPGTNEEIATFCKNNYGVTFPLADKSVVKGADAIPVYKWAGTQAGMLGTPKWNFHKYLFGKDGKFIDWFSTATKPMAPKIVNAIDKAVR
jgi:glutathione peroxidase